MLTLERSSFYLGTILEKGHHLNTTRSIFWSEEGVQRDGLTLSGLEVRKVLSSQKGEGKRRGVVVQTT